MKILHLAVFLLLAFWGHLMNAQIPNWDWARGTNSVRNNGMGSICLDEKGNVIVTGGGDSSKITLGGITITNPGRSTQNAFIAKYDALGNIIWAKGAVGPGQYTFNAVCTDHHGAIYLAGTFNGDSITLDNRILVHRAAPYNSFLAKYDSLGNVIWAKNLGGDGNSFIQNVASDALGNVFIVGYFFGDTITFDHFSLRDRGSSYTSFTAKFDPMGNVLWAKSAYDPPYLSNSYLNSADYVASDNIGNVYVLGDFNSNSMLFDTTYLSGSGNDLFFAKYDSAGHLIWVVAIDGGYAAGGLSRDSLGNIYITGMANNSIVGFGGASARGTFIRMANPVFYYVVKYTSDGNPLWAKSMSGPDIYMPTRVSVNNQSNIYVTGTFIDSLNIDSTLMLHGTPAYTNIFLAKFDSMGHIVWTKTAGASGSDFIGGIAPDDMGNIYIDGSFKGASFPFGSNVLRNYGSVGNQTLFLAKLDTLTATGVVENSSSPITIHPNPSTGTFYFSGLNPGSSIDIYDLLGQHIYTTRSDKENTAIDLSAHSTGVYLYRISDGTGSQQGKIVKE